MTSTAALADQRDRRLGVLRLSLTARCNLACPYCCPDAVDPPGLMSLDQQLRLIRVAALLGAHTLRLTGGEPLLSDRLLPLLEQVRRGRCTVGDPLQGLRQVALARAGTGTFAVVDLVAANPLSPAASGAIVLAGIAISGIASWFAVRRM